MERYDVKLSWDDEAKVWLANCDEIPLAMEDGSLDKLIYRVKIAAPELIELNNLPVDGKIKSRHTANAILKQSGINYHF